MFALYTTVRILLLFLCSQWQWRWPCGNSSLALILPAFYTVPARRYGPLRPSTARLCLRAPACTASAIKVKAIVYQLGRQASSRAQMARAFLTGSARRLASARARSLRSSSFQCATIFFALTTQLRPVSWMPQHPCSQSLLSRPQLFRVSPLLPNNRSSVPLHHGRGLDDRCQFGTGIQAIRAEFGCTTNPGLKMLFQAYSVGSENAVSRLQLGNTLD